MPSLGILGGGWVIGRPQQILKVLLTGGGDKTYNIQTVHVAVCVWKTCMCMTLCVFLRSEFGLDFFTFLSAPESNIQRSRGSVSLEVCVRKILSMKTVFEN